MKHLTSAAAILAAATGLVAITGCDTSATQASTNPPMSAEDAAATTTGAGSSAPGGNALAAARALTVKGRAANTGYSRSQFGKAWTDDNTDLWGHNGCDTRNDILKRDLTNVVYKNSAHCAVRSGTLHDHYTGKTIAFTRGKGTSLTVQIDHSVALQNAWVTGAQSWTPQQRTNYANDPLVLWSSDGDANDQKGSGDAATWLPSNKSFRACYVATQVAVKQKYHLWVTPAERDTMIRVLSSAPNTKLPTEPGGMCH